MIVVGDSHANQWTPALAAFGRAAHWRVILEAKEGCPPGIYPTDVNPETNRLYTQCNQWRSSVFAAAARIRPKAVVISSELRTLDIDPTGMVASVRKFQQTGARVIYLADTPNPEKIGPIPDCLARNSGDIQKCSMPRMAHGTRLEGFTQRRIEMAAVRQAGATVINPVSWFCTAVTCPPVINNIVVYEDISHVTATYARWLSPVMTSALEQATRGIGRPRQPSSPRRRHHRRHPVPPAGQSQPGDRVYRGRPGLGAGA